jgi:nucleotide-binding universal stress UspA family protein
MKFLLCSDGSPQAERALRLGASIAAGCQAQVTLLGISETPGTSRPLLDLLRRGQAWLEEKKVRAELITKSGRAVEEIVRRTEEASYDLVVIGAVRKQTWGRFWMSSKAYEIIKEIKPPVLSVAGACTTVQRLLLCTGGRRYGDAAIRLTGQIARGTGARVTILHVMPLPPAIYAGLRRMEETADSLLQSQSELGLNLRHAQETLRAQGVSVEVKLRYGSVLEEILRETAEGKNDIVVTGSALSQSLRTYMLGDISREIVNRADCAVLVVRGQPKPAEEHSGLLHWFGSRG